MIEPSLPLDACGKDSSPELLPTGEVLAEELGYLPLALAQTDDIPLQLRRLVALRDQHC